MSKIEGATKQQTHTRRPGALDVSPADMKNPQPTSFLQTWLEPPEPLLLGPFALDGQVRPVPEWAGGPADDVFELDGGLAGARFSLVVSHACALHLMAGLPGAPDLERATPFDLGLLFEHVLTPFLEEIERQTGCEAQFYQARPAVSGQIRMDGFGLYEGAGGRFPIGFASDSLALWAFLSARNWQRVQNAIQHELFLCLSPVLLTRDDAHNLREGDVILLEDAQPPELSGDMMLDDNIVCPVRLSPQKTIVEARPPAEPVNDPDLVTLRFHMGMLTLSQAELAGIEPGSEFEYHRLPHNIIQILLEGKNIGIGHIVQQEDTLGVQIQRMEPQ